MPSRKPPQDQALGLRSKDLCRLFGIPSSTLNYWVQIGLVYPSIRGPQGHRVEQYWSVNDAVAVQAVRYLRRAGASLQQVRKAAKIISEWGTSMSAVKLWWDGSDVKVQTPDGKFASALANPGQMAWFMAALPLDRWEKRVAKEASPVDLTEVARLNAQLAERRLQGAVSFEKLLNSSRKRA